MKRSKMALSYFPNTSRVGSPQATVESSSKHLTEGVQEAYVEQKNK